MSRFNAETAVVGCALIDPQAFWKVADKITADDFREDSSREVWDCISSLHRAGQAADAVTVAESLPELQSFIMATATATFSTANVLAYAEIVIADAVQRRVAQAGQRIAKLTGSDSLPEAQRILASCQPRATAAVRTMREYMREMIQTLHQRFESSEVLTGVETSLPELDELTAGWQRGDLIIFAARPSVGKTALALQAALHAAKRGTPVFFASLEQSGGQICERATAHLARVSLNNLRQPKTILEEEWPRITHAAETISALPIRIDETGALTVDAIGARARQMNADKRLGLIVIDYLTMIKPPKADKVTDGIQEITRALKALAKELSVPVILLSQLNRDGEDKPTLSKLRDSGAIEQDADVVLFLHRPDPANRELINLILAKQRNGPVSDELWLQADMAHMNFVSTHDRPAQRTARGFGRVA